MGTVNIICIVLTIYHLVKLYKDYTSPSADTVRVATLVTSLVCTDTDASEISSTSDLPPRHHLAVLPPESVPPISVQPDDQQILNADPFKVQKYLNRIEREGTERVKMFLGRTSRITWNYLFFSI